MKILTCLRLLHSTVYIFSKKRSTLVCLQTQHVHFYKTKSFWAAKSIHNKPIDQLQSTRTVHRNTFRLRKLSFLLFRSSVCCFFLERESLKYRPCPAQWGLCCLCNGIPSNKSMVFPYDRCDMANEKSGGRQRDETSVLSDVACAVIFSSLATPRSLKSTPRTRP